MSAKKSGRERMVSAAIMPFGPPCRSMGRSAGRVRRARVGDQGANEHQLGPVRGGGVAAARAEPARAADAGPVRRAVHRAAVARRVDERLQQQQRMAEALRPVRRQPPRAQRQHLRAQVRRARVRQDQEPAVVRDQVKPVVLGAEVPADPAVARAALQRRRREARQCQPLAAPMRDVPQRLADLRQRAQKVVRRHQLPIAALVPGRHRLDRHLAQFHAPDSVRQPRTFLHPFRPGVQLSG